MNYGPAQRSETPKFSRQLWHFRSRSHARSVVPAKMPRCKTTAPPRGIFIEADTDALSSQDPGCRSLVSNCRDRLPARATRPRSEGGSSTSVSTAARLSGFGCGRAGWLQRRAITVHSATRRRDRSGQDRRLEAGDEVVHKGLGEASGDVCEAARAARDRQRGRARRDAASRARFASAVELD